MNPNLTTRTGLVAPNAPCPKCKSYMFMTRQDDRGYFKLCKQCGYRKYDKLHWYERLMFWKY